MAKCLYCDKDIDWRKRSDSKYCDVKCRDEFNNKVKRVKHLIDRSNYLIDEAIKMASDNPNLKVHLDAKIQQIREQRGIKNS